MTDIKNPMKAAQTIYSASLLIEQCGSADLARQVAAFADKVSKTPVWKRVDTGHYQTVIDRETLDLRKRDDGQWLLESTWVGESGMRWFRSRGEAQGWVKRQAGAA